MSNPNPHNLRLEVESLHKVTQHCTMLSSCIHIEIWMSSFNSHNHYAFPYVTLQIGIRCLRAVVICYQLWVMKYLRKICISSG